MNFCFECGFSLEQGWKFCPQCNTRLEQSDYLTSSRQQIANNTLYQEIVECNSCSAQGNIVTKPCFGCRKRFCQNCLSKWGRCRNCQSERDSINLRQERERQNEEDRKLRLETRKSSRVTFLVPAMLLFIASIVLYANGSEEGAGAAGCCGAVYLISFFSMWSTTMGMNDLDEY